jgi:TetR/AcrR family transcriptional repressor of lmrAB and yxaGH operons
VPPGPRERLIISAIELVRARGVEGTGLSELLEHSRTARRSIYQHFPGGKAELVATSTAAAGAWLQRALRDLAGQGEVATLVRMLVTQVAENLAANDYTLGCPVAAAAAAAPDAVGVREAAAAVFDSWTEELAAALEREGRPEAEAASLAGFIVSAVEGALLRARCARSTDPLEQAANQLSSLLARSVTPPHLGG